MGKVSGKPFLKRWRRCLTLRVHCSVVHGPFPTSETESIPIVSQRRLLSITREFTSRRFMALFPFFSRAGRASPRKCSSWSITLSDNSVSFVLKSFCCDPRIFMQLFEKVSNNLLNTTQAFHIFYKMFKQMPLSSSGFRWLIPVEYRVCKIF